MLQDCAAILLSEDASFRAVRVALTVHDLFYYSRTALKMYMTIYFCILAEYFICRPAQAVIISYLFFAKFLFFFSTF